MRVSPTTSLLTVASFAAISTALCAGQEIEFNRHIRPILSDKCFACHGPDEKIRKANLRLDTRDGALRDLGGHSAIVPGNPDKSEIIARATSHDEDEVMPPPKAKKGKLSASEIATLRQWISQGAKYQGHWAFEPLSNSPPPATKHATWPKNTLDHFILASLEAQNIQPSPEANRETLIRRLYLDLVGLLPSPEEVRTFVEDKNPNAYETLVGRLLANPHYGERWGRHWLDQARYADSDGYAIDGFRSMWAFRDWVIHALNQDMPFDQFTIEQLAGDLLPNPDKKQLAATAFHRNTLINQEGGSDPEQFRVEAVMDRVNTTGAVWLGLTVGCAQCHTHKFDPITQTEYYQLITFFNSGEDRNNQGPTVNISQGEMFSQQTPAATKPSKLMVMRDLKTPRPTYLLTRGDFTRPDTAKGELAAGVLSAVPPKIDAPKNRLDLARWLVDARNPLTPRVTVNRIWMRYFGRGLVETEEDFGTQGTPPSDPGLLDALASSLIQNGWSLKKLHRLIVTSATYRQASTTRPELDEIDPKNYLLARQSRIRLDAEIIRDTALTASGLLVPDIGGPGVRPPQPAGVYAFTQRDKDWKDATGTDRYRRALYTVYFRSAPYPLFTSFDAPDFQTTCTRRSRSNTPLQALNIANDPAFLEFARGLAERVTREIPGDPAAVMDQRITHAFRLALCREPNQKERTILTKYANNQAGAYNKDSKSAPPFEAVARALLNTDNFITRE